jgi:hypothetical protein
MELYRSVMFLILLFIRTRACSWPLTSIFTRVQTWVLVSDGLLRWKRLQVCNVTRFPTWTSFP